MFTVYADENLLFDTTQDDYERILIDPKISLEANKPGLFSFIMPPGHVLYDGIERMKTNITLYQDGEEIFRGRVMDDETDIYNQKYINCEGELAYFIDSLQRPYEYDGTPYGLFELLISTHNEMVNENQRFTIGIVTAISNEGTAQVDTDEYADTLSELNSRMINAYGGYFRIRNVDGVRYIDYLADGDENEQPIEFGVNLLDLKKRISANDVFNVLIPKGTMLKGDNGRFTEALNIKEVNNGLDYIEDTAAIEQYGRRIWKTKQWNYIEDAQTLLEKGREYLATGVLEETTLNITAVDMQFVDKEKQRIGICDRVRILSNPHGLDRLDICTKIEGELMNPEQFQYTFGKPQLSLTDNVVLEQKKYGGGGGGGKTAKEEIDYLKRYADIIINEYDGIIKLYAKEIDALDLAVKRVEIDLDAAEAEITLKASKSDVDFLTNKVTQAEIDIDGAEAEIALKVSKNDVIGAINLTSESATIQADRINLEGYVTASNLDAAVADLNYANSQAIETLLISANQTDFNYLQANSFTHNGDLVTQRNVTMGNIASAGKALSTGGELDLSHSHAVIVNDDGTITLGEVSAEGGNFKIADTKAYKDGVSAARTAGANSVTLTAAGWVGGANVVSASNGKSETVNLPDFSASGGDNFTNKKTTVYFSTSSVSGPLASKEVDATDVYNEGEEAGYAEGHEAGYTEGHEAGYAEGHADGYAAGWAAALAMCEVVISGAYGNVITVKMPGETVDTAAEDDVYTVSSGGTLGSITNTAPNTFHVSGNAYAYIKHNAENRIAVSTTPINKSTTINVGQ